jgi:sulfur relay (sulfurtransferase) DsrC/TusE family protein
MADTKSEQSQRNERQIMLGRNVSMSPEQWALVDEVDQLHALNNTSAALRMIVETYRRVRGGEPSNTTAAGATSAP